MQDSEQRKRLADTLQRLRLVVLGIMLGVAVSQLLPLLEAVE